MSDSSQGDTTGNARDDSADAGSSEEVSVRIDGLTKVFESDGGSDVVAVDDVSVGVRRGEFLVLVGPSGCGKTTTLRSVAGLETPTEGRIVIEGTDVTGLDPRERDISMVFQNYALYPHKTVHGNIAFPLAVRNYPDDEIDQRVERAADLLDIPDLLDRKPGQLSGGQQQRVALGRAIVREPAVFLMDEPLSNLDAKLRVQMRTELNELHKRVGRTTIYVTHDQAEAMTLGDRVAVMNDGRLQQIGPPQYLYDNPANRFVAGFIGEPPMNFFPVEIDDDGGSYVVSSDVFEWALPDAYTAAIDEWEGSTANLSLGLRPEDISDEAIAGDVATPGTFEAYVRVVEPMGSDKFLTLAGADGDGTEFSARVAPESEVAEDETVPLVASLQKLHLFDEDTGTTITY